MGRDREEGHCRYRYSEHIFGPQRYRLYRFLPQMYISYYQSCQYFFLKDSNSANFCNKDTANTYLRLYLFCSFLLWKAQDETPTHQKHLFLVFLLISRILYNDRNQKVGVLQNISIRNQEVPSCQQHRRHSLSSPSFLGNRAFEAACFIFCDI